MSSLAEASLPAFFAAAAGEFEAAGERTGVVGVQLRFGEFGVRLRFAGGGLADALLAALAGRREQVGGQVHATIDLWEAAACLAGAVAAPWAIADIGPGGLVRGLDRDRVVAVHDTYAGAITVADRGNGAVLHRVPDCAAVPWWERAAPLRVALYWALSGPRRHFVHAGAVGDDRGGVLLAGASGSGKTTVALAALTHGLGYVADDYVLLNTTSQPHAIALYRTAKLDDGHLTRFASLADAVRLPPAFAATEKAVLDVGAASPSSLRASLPVRAVIVPRIRGGRASLRRIGPAEALLALAPSTMLQLPFDDRAAFGSLAALVRRVPCFGLDVGDDPSELAAAVQQALELSAQ
jgi:hypothetical protein